MKKKILDLIEKYIKKDVYLQKKGKKTIDDLRLILWLYNNLISKNNTFVR